MGLTEILFGNPLTRSFPKLLQLLNSATLGQTTLIQIESQFCLKIYPVVSFQ